MHDRPLGLRTFDRFADKIAIQLNDTHPALAIPELMRLLVDIEGLDWDEAWDITTRTFGYTNHTVMPEALERWPVSLLGAIRVSLAEQIIPGAELSEQISTAGTEASGTSNMKLALNGALTIGTLDGANVEIRDAVGDENFFVFGLTAEEAAERAARHDPWAHYRNEPELRRVLDMIGGGGFSPGELGLFAPIVHSLLDGGDRYLVLADYGAYVACQDRVAEAYRDKAGWTRKSILNTARMGAFSSDRTIRQYAEEIWGVTPRAGARRLLRRALRDRPRA
jgi:starch phosphorylase